MDFKPHVYQEYATDWIILKPASALFLDMGLGKTACTLNAAVSLMHDSFEVNKILVIAPLRVALNTWTSERDKWDQFRYLKVSKVLGSEKKRMAALKEKADIYIINRENVPWLVEQLRFNWYFDMMVIDELSSFKNSASKRFKALKKVRHCIKRIVGLTGTPAPNGLMDLWAQVALLDDGMRLGSTLDEYRHRYFWPDRVYKGRVVKWKLRRGADGAIFDRLKDICMSMKAEDYLRLPKKINNFIEISLPEGVIKKYIKLEEELAVSLEGSRITATNFAVLGGKLLQMASGAVYDENRKICKVHEEKLRALEEVIDEANGKSVLVFYYYRHDLERIKKHLEGRDFRVLQSEQDIEDWNRGEISLLLANPASAGHGLNLQQGGNIIVWFSLIWSLELYQQANARLHRQGQRSHVIVHHIIAKGTIDEDVMKVLQRKEARQEDLMEAVKARLKREHSWRVTGD